MTRKEYFKRFRVIHDFEKVINKKNFNHYFPINNIIKIDYIEGGDGFNINDLQTIKYRCHPINDKSIYQWLHKINSIPIFRTSNFTKLLISYINF